MKNQENNLQITIEISEEKLSFVDFIEMVLDFEENIKKTELSTNPSLAC